MPQLDHALTLLLSAIPNPQEWSGSAAHSCCIAIEALADELRSLQMQLSSGWAHGDW